VLDNFEQLVAAAPSLSELLRGTEHLKLIVTSRAVLRVSGEQELPVPPLGLPDPHAFGGVASLSQFDAVRLFIERGVAAKPGFEVTNENAPAVAEITSRLDGLPLAIELAAARLRLLTPQAILARLGDRLALLSGGARDLPERQQTLRAAIAWSYDLLGADERDLFERVGVFMGGWTLDAAEAVAGSGAAAEGGQRSAASAASASASSTAMDVLDGLASLSEKSLLRPQEDAHGDSRFLMLETIRAYAVERLNGRPDVEAIREQHAAWYLGFAESIAGDIGGGDRRELLNHLEDDHDNLRAALAWFMAGNQLPEAARMVVALWRFWQQHGHLSEARLRADELLALDDQRHVLGDRQRGAVLTAAGGIAYWQGDFLGAHVRYRDALAIARASGPPLELAEALYNFAFAPIEDSSPDRWFAEMALQSPGLAREAAERFREAGDMAGQARAMWGLANFLSYARDYRESAAVLADALPLFRTLGDRFGEGWTHHTLGLAKYQLDEPGKGTDEFDEALRLFADAGDVSGITLSLLDLASALFALGRLDDAYRLVGAGKALATRTGAGLAQASQPSDGALPGLPPDPTDPTLIAAVVAGAALSVDEAVAIGHEAARRALASVGAQ